MNLYDIEVVNKKQEKVKMEQYKGDVILVVNTASKCGFTPQFDGLEELNQKYKDDGLTILGFPCNQFGKQDPGSNEEIQEFCKLNYGVTFEMMSKIDVNGKDASELFKYLKKEKTGLLGSDIKWNFTKFLIDRDGNVVKRFAPKDEPSKMVDDIEKLIK
jgi:glutathione peroxidase